MVASGLALVPHVAAAATLPPAPRLANQSTLTILRGDSQYSEQARAAVVAAVDGQDVRVGDRLITGQDANLLLTFFEGSTLTLTPGTDVVVERLQAGTGGDAAARDFQLQLNAGTIWARVVSLASSAATFQVRTPNAVAVVRGSQIGARVLPDGSFQCWTREGVMSVQTGAGQQVDLQAGETVLVQPDGQLSATRPFSPSVSVLRFRVTGPVWPLVVHPDGGANGVVEPGIVVSQTFGALVTPPAAGDGGFSFEVPASIPGRYTLVLEGQARAGAGDAFGALATGLLSPLYAGTENPDERLLTAAEIGGQVAAGELVAVDLDVQLARPGAADAILAELRVSQPYRLDPAAGPLGPAKVRVSEVEAGRAGQP